MSLARTALPPVPDSSAPFRAARRRTLAALAAVPLAACMTRKRDPLADLRVLLAPSGRLHVGLVRGSPLSILGDPVVSDPGGVGYEMGRALAYRLDVPLAPVLLARPAEVLTELRQQRIDIAFPALPVDRLPDVVFTSAFLQVDLAYLVVAGVRVRYANDMDRPDLRIGVTTGGIEQQLLAATVREAQIVPVPNATAAVAMLASGKIDAFAGDKPALARVAAPLQGTRLIEGRWGVLRTAAALHVSRQAGLPYVQQFVTAAVSEGLVDRAAQEAGIVGPVTPGVR